MTSSDLSFVRLTHSLGELDAVLDAVSDAVVKEVLRLEMSGVRSESLRFSFTVFSPSFVKKMGCLFDELVVLAERACPECDTLPVSVVDRQKVLEFVKVVWLSFHNAESAPGLVRKCFMIGNLKGVLEGVSSLRAGVSTAREIVEALKNS